MRISTLTADNFKSLVDFRLELDEFNCLIGLNGAGKSTVLQFIDFLAQLVRGDIEGWLSERSWLADDIKSKLIEKTDVTFSATLVDAGDSYVWKGTFDPKSLQCTSETIEVPSAGIKIEAEKGHLRIFGPMSKEDAISLHSGFHERQPIPFEYQGSILSQLKDAILPHHLREFKRFFEGTKALDLLALEHLRQPTKDSSEASGHVEQKFAAFLHGLTPQEHGQIVQNLRAVYPRLEGLQTKTLPSGLRQLEAVEVYEGDDHGNTLRLTTESRHLADGVLRTIAIFAELATEHRVLTLDEIENGINPETVEFVLDALVSSPRQIIVTTHSPVILNYLDDEVAKKGVVYVYRDSAGRSRVIRFFSIPSVAEKLKFMGPGEAFADTDLVNLQDEIEAIAEGA